jgi:hypothetical protein
MHQLLYLLVVVMITLFALTVLDLIVRYSFSFSDSMKVASCSYSRVFGAFLQGRFNVHSGLMTTQCISDML